MCPFGLITHYSITIELLPTLIFPVIHISSTTYLVMSHRRKQRQARLVLEGCVKF